MTNTQNMDTDTQKANQANTALKPPVGLVTQAINKQLRRFMGMLFIWPYFVICLLCAVIGGWILYQGEHDFMLGISIILAPYALMLGGILIWMVLASYLIMLFGEDPESRIGSVWFFSISFMPASLLVAFGDTYYMSALPDQAYMLLFMGLLIVGLYVFFQHGDELFEWGIKYVNPVTHGYNLILILALTESFVPYPESRIEATTVSDCYIAESTSTTGSRRASLRCLAEFEYQGEQKQVWFTHSGDNIIVIRHGLFDHYH